MIILRMMSVVILSIILLGCSKGNTSADSQAQVLAIVGNDTISSRDLRSYVEKQNRAKIDLQRDEVRQGLLQDLVQNKLVYFYAREKKLNEVDEIKLDVTTKSDEIYYEKILRNYVYFPLISEEDIRSFYEKLKTEVRVQQIFIGYKNPNKTFVLDKNEPLRSRTEAKHLVDSLYAVLVKSPQLFGTLAESFSNDQNSKYLKGDVGFRRWGMKPELEKNIFDLKTGEISQPVEAKYGYYLFSSTERRNVDNLKSYEEAKSGVKDMMITYLFRERKEEINSRKQKFSDSLLNQYNYTPNKANGGIFLRKYDAITTPADISTAFNESETDLVLASFRNGIITIAELVHVMKNNVKKIKMDEETLNDGLRSVSLRRIFSDLARKQQYELDNDEKESLKQYEARLMIGLAVEELYKAMEIKERDIQDYYETNKDEYRQPGTITVAEIASPDLKAVTQLSEGVKKKNNFEEMYNQAQKLEEFKCRTTGSVAETHSEEIIQKAKNLSTGGVSEPFMKVNKEYAIIKVIDRKKGEAVIYDKIKDRVKQDFVNFKRQITYNEWIANLSAQYKVQIFSDRLKNVFDVKMK